MRKHGIVIGFYTALLGACGSAKFVGRNAPTGTTLDPAGEHVVKDGESVFPPNENPLFEKGRSLDLYTIFDVSGSLGQRTDPNCNRFDAFTLFLGGLRARMGQGASVRLTIITFAQSARFVASIESLFSASAAKFAEAYRADICATDGPTNPKLAFDMTVEKAKFLIASSPKQVASVLFFSDGAPSYGPDQLKIRLPGDEELPGITKIRASIRTLQETFPARVFSVLMGSRNNKPQQDCAADPECPPLPIDFVNEVSGDPGRVRLALDSDALAAALMSFLK